MNIKTLHQVAILAQKIQRVFVATSNYEGFPHIATAGKLDLNPEGRVVVAAWFCPTTVLNLERNRRVALVVWDPKTDVGYQLLGETEEVNEVAMMNGYLSDQQDPMPQVERQLIVRVDKIISFKQAPHSDLEE